MNSYRSKLSVLCQFVRNISAFPKTSKYGQPTSVSHPHLIKPGEVLPSIQISEFQNRRQKLMDLIYNYSKLVDSSKANIVVIPSATKKYMSDKIPYVFRQNTDYLYLSGCLEPDSCLVLHKKANSSDHASILFVRNPDPQTERWDGPSTSPKSAPKLFGVDRALPMADLSSFLHSYIATNKNCILWYDKLYLGKYNLLTIINALSMLEELLKLPNIYNL